ASRTSRSIHSHFAAGCWMSLAIRPRYSRGVRTASIVWFFAIAVVDVGAQIRAGVQAWGFDAPVGFVQDPTDRTTQFVVQQNGRIRALRSAHAPGPRVI